MELFDLNQLSPKYQIDGVLIKAMYGAIYKAHNNENNKYAIKVVDTTRHKMDDLVENPVKELEFWKNIGPHYNLVDLVDYYEDDYTLCMVMPMALSDGFDFVQNNNYTIDQAVVMYNDLLNGLLFLHGNGWCHRDVSIENCFIYKNGDNYNLKLGDFGQVTRCDTLLSSIDGCPGKLPYISPEIFNTSNKYDGVVSDVWASGIILYVLLFKSFPWEYASKKDKIFEFYLENGLHALLCLSKKIIDDEMMGYVNIIEGCLSVNPKRRPTIKTLINFINV